ncbi:hypothetical protein DJ84_23575 [Halorubrum ezzemoulense]|nr:hypothetical protein DJ84_23575 [Halorubrum ezzemoulense]
MRSRGNRTVVLLIEESGWKGEQVVSHLIKDKRFSQEFDLRAVIDREGDTAEFLDRCGVPWTAADSPTDPQAALDRVAPEDGIDYLVACGWGYILEKQILRIPNQEALNCHSSYLPDYKGLSVYRAQWANAESSGGATIHIMKDDLDEGPIISQGKFKITLWDSPLDIAHKYSDLTAPLLREAIELLENGYEGVDQTGGRYYTKIPWSVTVVHGLINHLLRGINSSFRWEVEPKRGHEPPSNGEVGQ